MKVDASAVVVDEVDSFATETTKRGPRRAGAFLLIEAVRTKEGERVRKVKGSYEDVIISKGSLGKGGVKASYSGALDQRVRYAVMQELEIGNGCRGESRSLD
jgi:hypothetical protein